MIQTPDIVRPPRELIEGLAVALPISASPSINSRGGRTMSGVWIIGSPLCDGAIHSCAQCIIAQLLAEER
jgi:hypothetical protein